MDPSTLLCLGPLAFLRHLKKGPRAVAMLLLVQMNYLGWVLPDPLIATESESVGLAPGFPR